MNSMRINWIFFFTILILGFTGFQLRAQELFLNEFMASNSQTLEDGSGDFEDWIEIYNNGVAPVNISGYYLTDDLNNLKKFRLNTSGTALVIPAKGYLIVWASNNTAKGPLHLGFGLSAGGESLALVAPDGITLLDSYVFGVQKQDISQGRSENGAGSWVFFGKPTPGKSNHTSPGYEGFLNPPSFGKQGGFYTESFPLNFTTNEPGARIVYTLDGSDPDPGNINGKAYNYKNSYPGKVGDGFGPLLSDTLRSYLFQDAVVINDRTTEQPELAGKSSTVNAQPYIPPSDFFKGTSVRARVIKDGYLPSEIITQTYFVTAKGSTRYTLPVSALTIPANQLFGYEEGIYNAGKDFDVWRSKNPLETNLYRAYINFTKSGDASERIGHFEYFSGNTPIINQAIGLRLHGSSGRFGLIKTLRLYARSELGKSSFDHSFFADYPYGSFKRLLLRPDDWERTAIRDFAVQHLAKGLKFDIQQGQPSVLFINGEFWGLHTVRERYDRYFFEIKYGIADGELDLLEDNALVEEGDNKDYLALRSFIKTKDLNEPANYEYVRSKMDLENYTDYFINGMFITNRDWPNNNIRFYRKNTPSASGSARELDGRWRWLLFDTDASYTNPQVNDNYLERIIPNENVFLKNLLVVPAYRDYFITRYADLLNSVYVSSICTAKIDSIAALVQPFVAEHRYRLVNDSSVNFWTSGITDMKNFARRRPGIVFKHLTDYFGLADTQRISVNVLQPEMGYVSVNTLDIKEGTPGIAGKPYPWQGIYFEGLPVKLIAKPRPGYRFLKWQGDTSLIKDTLTLWLTDPVSVEAVFEPDLASPTEQLIHYWHFNSLPSGTLQSVTADSSIAGGAFITYPGSGTGYLDRVAGEGSSINTQYGIDAGTALRVRNPSSTRELKLQIPSTGFGDIAIGWATVRTGSGAQEQKVFYSTTEGNTEWTEITGVITVSESYQLNQISLKGIKAAENNHFLAIKVVFSGSNAAGSSGNNRFDNITISGKLIESNCNGNLPQIWYRDADNDGFSDGSRVEKCTMPAGYKLLSSLAGTVVDCNDLDSLQKPSAIWYKDADNDGYSEGSVLLQCNRPQGFKNASELMSVTGDCDDNDLIINPGTVWFKDEDADGFSDGGKKVQCQKPAGYLLEKDLKAITGDCNDLDSTLNPETSWFKDSDNDGYSSGTVLNQCLRPDGYKLFNELIAGTVDCKDDDREINPETVWYKDTDGDGYSNGFILAQCLRPGGYKLPAELISVTGDCNDAEAGLNPTTVWYKDNDNDGYSDGQTTVQCLQPIGYKTAAALIALSGDCNDGLAAINPTTIWYKDADGDGYSDGITRVQCAKPEGFALVTDLLQKDGDCNDNDATIFPGGIEFPDGKDNDCNGSTDEGPALDIRVAPNPVHQQLGLWMRVFVPNQKIEISLIGSDGRVYLLGSVNPVQFGQRINFDVRNHAAGTYLIRVRQGANQLTQKILIIR